MTTARRSFRRSASLSRDRDLRGVHCRQLARAGTNTCGALQLQTLKRLRPALFRQDLIALFDLLQHHKIKPLIAHRFPLAEARHAHELLGTGGVTGKIVLVLDGPSLEPAVT